MFQKSLVMSATFIMRGAGTAADLFMGLREERQKKTLLRLYRKNPNPRGCLISPYCAIPLYPYHTTHTTPYRSLPYYAAPHHTAVSPSLSSELGPPALVRQGVLWLGHASYVHSAREIDGSIIQPPTCLPPCHICGPRCQVFQALGSWLSWLKRLQIFWAGPCISYPSGP